ncbi:hypothetical protein R6Q59_016502 [Mikania micrantha]
MQTDTSIYLFDHYSVTPDLENGEMFDGTKIVVNAISSKDYVLAYKMRSFIKDHDTVLMAIAQNFPAKSPSVNAEGRKTRNVHRGNNNSRTHASTESGVVATFPRAAVKA